MDPEDVLAQEQPQHTVNEPTYQPLSKRPAHPEMLREHSAKAGRSEAPDEMTPAERIAEMEKRIEASAAQIAKDEPEHQYYRRLVIRGRVSTPGATAEAWLDALRREHLELERFKEVHANLVHAFEDYRSAVAEKEHAKAEKERAKAELMQIENEIEEQRRVVQSAASDATQDGYTSALGSQEAPDSSSQA